MVDVYIKLNVAIDRNNLVDGAFEVIKQLRPEWLITELKWEVYNGGITNQLVKVFHTVYPKDHVLIRVYGKNTENIIDRNHEIKIMQLLCSLNLSSKVYATFLNGFAYQYLPGKVLNEESCSDKNIYPLVAEKMAQLHLQLPKYIRYFGKERSILWDKIYSFISLTCAEVNKNQEKKSDSKRFQGIPNETCLIQELKWLCNHLKKFKSPVVLCHNDLLLGNVLHDDDLNTVNFIDFEYAGPNYQAYDIANHFNEFVGISAGCKFDYPVESIRLSWIQTYMKTYYNREHVEELEVRSLMNVVEQFRLASYFFCATWGFYQTAHSTLDFDFKGYSSSKFSEYFRVKEMLLSANTGNHTH